MSLSKENDQIVFYTESCLLITLNFYILTKFFNKFDNNIEPNKVTKTKPLTEVNDINNNHTNETIKSNVKPIVYVSVMTQTDQVNESNSIKEIVKKDVEDADDDDYGAADEGDDDGRL